MKYSTHGRRIEEEGAAVGVVMGVASRDMSQTTDNQETEVSGTVLNSEVS